MNAKVTVHSACEGSGEGPSKDSVRISVDEHPAPKSDPSCVKLAEDCAKVYIDLVEALRTEHKAATALSEAKQAHADAVMNVVLEYADKPKELGANDAVREARIALLTEETATALHEAEKAMAQAKHETELARLGVQYVRELRRILVGVEVSE